MVAPTNYIQFPGFTKDVQFSPEGDLLAAADENRVWLLTKGQFSPLTAPLQLQGEANIKLKANVKDLLISPDSKWIGITTEAGELILYDVRNGERNSLMTSDPAPSFVFSPDSLQIITASGDGRVQAWDVASGKLVNSLLEEIPGTVSLAASNDLLAVGLSERILLWDLNEGQRIPEIVSTGDHRVMAFSPNGDLLASASSFGQINIWRQKNGSFELLHSMNKGEVFSLAFNPQGDQLIVGGRDVVYVLDPLQGVETARIRHQDAVNGLSFSPDGAILATASVKVVQFWDATNFPILHTAELIPTACQRVIRNFDEGEWAAFFGEEDEFTVLCENLQK
jgi:WD40 repeat protein